MRRPGCCGCCGGVVHCSACVTEREVEDISSEQNYTYGGVAEQKEMRVFESGATRNVEVDPDYHGFLSPLALHAYGEYMHRHRLQADGTLRDSDNWQKGIPNDAFVRSLVRHVHDIQLVFDGYGEFARQDDRDDNVLLAHLSAALFNVQGMLHNVMLALLEDERQENRIAEAIAVVEARREQA